MTEKQIGTHPPYAQFAVAVQRGSMMGSGEGRGPRKGSKPSDHSGNARHGMGPSTGGGAGLPVGAPFRSARRGRGRRRRGRRCLEPCERRTTGEFETADGGRGSDAICHGRSTMSG